MPDIHLLIILLSFLGIIIWGCCLRHSHNRVLVDPPDKRLTIDRLLEALTHHNDLLDELVERLVRIENHLLEDQWL
jgi:hypothetical protein